MWNNYGGMSNESVAIETTYQDVLLAYSHSNINMEIYFDKVKYKAPDNKKGLYDLESIAPTFRNKEQPVLDSNFTWVAHYSFIKHIGYDSEKEARLVLLDSEGSINKNNKNHGVYLSSTLSKEMIKSIVIHPNAPIWFEKTVTNLIKNTYKLDIPVINSSLKITGK
jgi:hypothetical protein